MTSLLIDNIGSLVTNTPELGAGRVGECLGDVDYRDVVRAAVGGEVAGAQRGGDGLAAARASKDD